MNILNTIVANKRIEVAAAKSLICSEKAIKERAFSTLRSTASFSARLRQSELGIIAEFKRCSPSKGAIKLKADAAEIVPAYERAGAAACSVLTDTRFFGGAVTDLMVARSSARLPLLRKDFIVDDYQIYEARVAGADAVLLIASVLSVDEMTRMTEVAHSLGLETLVEVHDADEAAKVPATADVVGINNRNLKDFSVSLDTSLRLFDRLPSSAVKISESGIRSVADIAMLRAHGFEGFLIGERFMATDNPGEALAQFINGYDS